MTTTDHIYNNITAIHTIKCSMCECEEKEEMKEQDVAAAMFQKRGWIANQYQVLCNVCKNKKR